MVNKFLLAEDTFMPEIHLKQLEFTYSACGPFPKNEARIQKFKEIGCSRYIYKNELDKPCFQHVMAFGDFKQLTRRTASDKALRDKAFNIAKNPKYDGYQRGLSSMVYKIFDKKSTSLADKSAKGSGFKLGINKNEQLAEELLKPVIIKFEKGMILRICN